MKLFGNQFDMNAKTKLSLALCTVLALSAAALRADDDKNKGAPGNDSTATSSKLSHSDEKFIKDACRGNHMEVQMGKLGVQKAQSDQVKQYAQRLIDDHTKADTELKQLASSKGLTLPSEKVAGTSEDYSDRTRVREKSDTDAESHKEHAGLKKLEGLSGTEFDREFVRMAVKDHENDIKEFEKASQKADDAQVKAFAAKALPTLREHLSQAKSLQSQIGSAGAPGSDSATDAGSKSGKISTSDSVK
jgi:putative membrane protein